jgi:hypothetical protein
MAVRWLSVHPANANSQRQVSKTVWYDASIGAADGGAAGLQHPGET